MQTEIERNAENNGREAAFARTANKDGFAGAEGLTKREYFAAMAMHGLLAHSGFGETRADIALNAVMLADALLIGLEKQRP